MKCDDIKGMIISDFENQLNIYPDGEGCIVSLPLRDIYGTCLLLKISMKNDIIWVSDMGHAMTTARMHSIEGTSKQFADEIHERYAVSIEDFVLMSPVTESIIDTIIDLQNAILAIQKKALETDTTDRELKKEDVGMEYKECFTCLKQVEYPIVMRWPWGLIEAFCNLNCIKKRLEAKFRWI